MPFALKTSHQRRYAADGKKGEVWGRGRREREEREKREGREREERGKRGEREGDIEGKERGT